MTVSAQAGTNFCGVSGHMRLARPRLNSGGAAVADALKRGRTPEEETTRPERQPKQKPHAGRRRKHDSTVTGKQRHPHLGDPGNQNRQRSATTNDERSRDEVFRTFLGPVISPDVPQAPRSKEAVGSDGTAIFAGVGSSGGQGLQDRHYLAKHVHTSRTAGKTHVDGKTYTANTILTMQPVQTGPPRGGGPFEAWRQKVPHVANETTKSNDGPSKDTELNRKTVGTSCPETEQRNHPSYHHNEKLMRSEQSERPRHYTRRGRAEVLTHSCSNNCYLHKQQHRPD